MSSRELLIGCQVSLEDLFKTFDESSGPVVAGDFNSDATSGARILSLLTGR